MVQNLSGGGSVAQNRRARFDYFIDEQIEAVTKVCDVAGKEFAIEQAMDKMEGEWQGVNLEIVAYRETGTFVLKGFDTVQQLLDDHIVMTQSMSFSPFRK